MSRRLPEKTKICAKKAKEIWESSRYRPSRHFFAVIASERKSGA